MEESTQYVRCTLHLSGRLWSSDECTEQCAKNGIKVLAASIIEALSKDITKMGPGATNANNLHFLNDFSIVDNLLGKGGSGNVVEGAVVVMAVSCNVSIVPRNNGRHLASNTSVAIKVIDPLQRSNAERARKLFEREVRLHSLVSDLPGVIRLLGASPPSSKSRCYLATELATMGDLFVLLKKRRALTERQVRDVVVQLLAAVAGLHRNNICHRDIKPENILLERSQFNPGGVKVMIADFGHAGLLPAGKALLHTRDCGTPGYRAPELGGAEKHGHGLAADLWSVGSVMNDCFSFKTRQPSVNDATFWTREIWDSVSTNARDLLGRLLEADPCKRITADEALRHPWLAGGKSETVCRGISASGSTKPVAGKGDAPLFLQELCNINNATKSSTDGAKDVMKSESRLKRVKNARPFKVLETEKDWKLKQPRPGRTITSQADDASGNDGGSGKTAKGEVRKGSAEEGGSASIGVCSDPASSLLGK